MAIKRMSCVGDLGYATVTGGHHRGCRALRDRRNANITPEIDENKGSQKSNTDASGDVDEKKGRK
jgi:hypothetical protein